MSKKTPDAFQVTRDAIAKELAAAARKINRLLAKALKSGVMITLRAEGVPRYDVAVLKAGTHGSGRTAFAEWAGHLKICAGRRPYPSGGDADWIQR